MAGTSTLVEAPRAMPMASAKSKVFSGTEGVYLLPHHIEEIDRLRRQHEFMRSTTEGMLVPFPLPSNGGKIKVLDAGCADGTWLRDLAASNPGRPLELHGVDIGGSLFPQESPNVDLRAHNLLEPFPESWGWKGSMDIVHQRLLIWGFKLADWPKVLRNHCDALKPGGKLLLVEAEWINQDKPNTLPQLQKQAAMQAWSTSTFGMDIHIAYKLENLLADAGFVDIQKKQYNHGYGAKARDPRQADPSAELWVECFRGLENKMPAGGIPDVAADAAAFHDFLDKLEVEIKTYGYQPKLNFVYGTKP